MSDERWGAYPHEWEHWAYTLGLLADLLPVVSNPGAVISRASTLKSLGKTPSWYNAERQVAGIAKWTEHQTTRRDVERWAKEPDYGICVQTRRVSAIDIDVDVVPEALEIVLTFLKGYADLDAIPVRWRIDSGRLLVPIMSQTALDRVPVKLAEGTIEILTAGRQFVAAGTHPKGERYQWMRLGQLLVMRELA